jgi:energy-coupling factor transporter transmembrane protein EcfT
VTLAQSPWHQILYALINALWLVVTYLAGNPWVGLSKSFKQIFLSPPLALFANWFASRAELLG